MTIPAKLSPCFGSAKSAAAKMRDILGRTSADITRFTGRRAFAAAAYLLAAFILIFSAAAFTKVVKISDKTGVKYVLTVRSDPRAILSQCGVKLNEADKYGFSGFKNNLGAINILRAFPVTVSADKATKTVMLADGTVSDALKKADVDLGPDDIINLPVAGKVKNGTHIDIQRVSYKTVVQDQTITCNVQTQETTLLEKGTAQVVQSGQNGTYTIKTRLRYVDGAMADQQVVSKQVTKKPVSAKVMVGTAIKTPVSKIEPAGFVLTSTGIPERYSRCYEGLATAYCAQNGGPQVASGGSVGIGKVAVDPTIFPYGTKLYIVAADGSVVYGYAVSADTGGFVKNKNILVDLYFNTVQQCENFGVRGIKIYVLN